MSSLLFRIVHINDVYELDNFPSLKTIIDNQRQQADKVVGSLAGDFLAPSILSGIDGGKGMINVMKLTGIDYVCFGNHEADIPQSELVKRIGEFTEPRSNSNHKGYWINSNMPGFSLPLPEYVTEDINSKDGTHSRKVVFLGLNMTEPKIYSATAFGGALKTMTPVNETAIQLNEKLKDSHDLVIPLTHQGMVDDEQLAKTGLFEIILGGHEHEELFEKFNPGYIVKTGMDAHRAAIIDVFWKDPSSKKPEVTVKFVTVKDFEADPVVLAEVKKHKEKVEALQMAVLYTNKSQKTLSSKNIKWHQTTLGTLLADICKEELEVEAAFLDSGSIRGNTDYVDNKLRLANLRKELPFSDTELSIVVLPGTALTEIVQYSRRLENQAENSGYFQADSGLLTDPDSKLITHIGGSPFNPDKEYRVAIQKNSIYGMNKNEPLIRYYSTHPKPTDGTSVLSIVIKNLCKNIWKTLPRFSEMDVNNDGYLSYDEVLQAYTKAFFDLIDNNKNGIVDPLELQGANLIINNLMTIFNLKDGLITADDYYNLF